MKDVVCFFCVCALVLCFSQAQAATYYVATDGNDSNNGSISSPWATLSKANATLVAGDTLYIRGGTYTGQSVTNWTASGTAGNPITISNYSGETPVFDGQWMGEFVTFGPSASGYITWRGLEITNYEYSGIFVAYGSYVTIQDSYFHNIHANNRGAVCTGAYPDSNVSHVIIERNHFKTIGRDLNTPFDHSVYVSAHSRYVTIRSNYFEDQIYGTTLTDCSAGGDCPNLVIYNNIIRLNPQSTRAGAYFTGAADAQIYNNTWIIDSGSMTQLYGAIAISAGIYPTVKNNIFYGATPLYGYIYNWDPSGYAADYNLYYPGAVDHHDTGGHSLSADPQFADSAYHLGSNSSAAIDRGTNISSVTDDYDGVTRPQGNAWDIGAYEYVSGTPRIIYGDVSGDGKVSAYDAAMVGQYAVSLISLTPEQITRADVSGGGGVSAYDAALIAQKAVGLITKFPVEG